MIVPLEHILILAGVLFFLGMGGLLAWRANLIMMLVCIEVMLNAVMLVFVGARPAGATPTASSSQSSSWP